MDDPVNVRPLTIPIIDLYEDNPVTEASVVPFAGVTVAAKVNPDPPLDGTEEIQVVPLDVNTFPLLPGETNLIVDVPFPSNTLLAVNDERPVPPLPATNVPATVTFPPTDVLGVSPVVPNDSAVTPEPAATPVEIHAVPLLVSTFPADPGEDNPVPPLETGISNVMLPLAIVTFPNVRLLRVLTVFPSWILVFPSVIGVAKLASN
jgi:hypothetical protein